MRGGKVILHQTWTQHLTWTLLQQTVSRCASPNVVAACDHESNLQSFHPSTNHHSTNLLLNKSVPCNNSVNLFSSCKPRFLKKTYYQCRNMATEIVAETKTDSAKRCRKFATETATETKTATAIKTDAAIQVDSAIGADSAIKADSSIEERPKYTLKTRLKHFSKEYGRVGTGMYLVLSFTSWGLFYSLISSGVDVVGLLQYCSLLSEETANAELAGGASTLLIAYLCHKIFQPVRILMTITCTPPIVRKLRNIGWLKKADK